MKVKCSLRFFAMACGVTLLAQGLVAQSTIQLFGPTSVSSSLPQATYGNPYAFNISTVNMTCPTSEIQAMLSGPLMNSNGTAPVLVSGALQPLGNILVDNNIIVTVTPVGNGATTPANVCPVNSTTISGEGLSNENCFNSTYQGSASGLTGLDPDIASISEDGPTIDYIGGVPPIDISSYLATSGSPQSVTIALTDEGGEYDNSTVFLTTNCTLGGVSGGTISGSPITGTSSTQTQSFTFNSNPGNGTPQNPPQVVSLIYDVSQVTNADNGSTPKGTDAPLAQSDFQTLYVPGTSFATSSCLIHQGEVLTNTTTPACKLYTLECIDPNTGLAAGVNCPVSDLVNEGVTDFFDGPQFPLQNINTPFGVFHEGIGFLMASDDWSPTHGGPCAFDTTNNTPVATQPCPQNLLVSFSGPGTFKGTGLTTNPNSTFISIAGVPEDHTTVLVAGEWPDNWVSNKSPTVYFTSQAPNLSKGASALNSANKLVALPTSITNVYVPAPIKSITYGISALNNPTPPLPANEPITDDNTINNPATTCALPLPTSKTEPNFATGSVSLQFPNGGLTAPLPDGKYLLHYFAQDCAGTQELQFNLYNDPNNNNAPTWSTTFYTVPINIDTTAPVVTTPTLSPAGPYKVGQTVTATYSCSDAPSGSGVVLCGLNVYAPEAKYSVGPLTTKFIANSTHKFTVDAIDGAGNVGSATATYTTH